MNGQEWREILEVVWKGVPAFGGGTDALYHYVSTSVSGLGDGFESFVVVLH